MGLQVRQKSGKLEQATVDMHEKVSAVEGAVKETAAKVDMLSAPKAKKLELRSCCRVCWSRPHLQQELRTDVCKIVESVTFLVESLDEERAVADSAGEACST
eukprot:3135555-Amphidinium_carterae.1